MTNPTVKPSTDNPQPIKPVNPGKGKGRTIKSRSKHATPSIKDFPNLPAAEKKQLQAHLIQPIPYKDRNGSTRMVTIRRKIYFWFRLKGYKHSEALSRAGLCRFTGESRLSRSKATKALATHWDIDSLNLPYILDRLVDLVESGKNENSRVRALKLLSELKGYLVNHYVIDVNERLQVNFSMSGPVLCPHCNRNTLNPPATIPALVSDSSAPVIDADFTVDQVVDSQV